MGNAIGFFEIPGIVAATFALDQMLKAANVEFYTWEKRLGGRLVTIVIRGEVSAVRSALDAAEKTALKKPVGNAVLANPHPEIIRILDKSAAKYEVKEDNAKSQNGETNKNNKDYIKEI